MMISEKLPVSKMKKVDGISNKTTTELVPKNSLIVETIVFAVQASFSHTLSITGFGLIVISKPSSVAPGLSISNKVLCEIVINEIIKNKTFFERI